MADQIQFPDHLKGIPGMPQINPQMMIAQNTERIAVGLDLLVGILSEEWGYDLKEEKLNGNTVLRWRRRGAEAPESESEESPDSQA